MKVMRIATLGVALLLVAATAADAQGRRGGGRGRGGVGALMQNITVTPEIQTQIDTIVAKYRTETQAVMQAAGGGGGGGGGRGMQLDSASQAKVNEINAKRNAEIRALLTAEQQKTFDENVAAVAAGRGRGRRGGGDGAAPPPPPPPPPTL
jgi:Spy/CpxP family protein refolding chaperone